MKMAKLAGLVIAAVALAGPPARAQEARVAVNVVGYDGLKEVVQKNRGKVVVVDFWGDFCPPCKKNMPHLVEMYQKLADRGLAVITVSIDSFKEDPDVKGRLEKFLASKNATFTANLLLDEPVEAWQKKLRFVSVPTVYVFDRRGKWVQFTDEQYNPGGIDRLVAELLAERP